ncbi:MAG: Pre-rRNA-processing protein TSR2-domain-containing protein [Monoraphidium minutum]|nr:MAG: Pre-rRNA-processing protein TSR2-domain-containing protein [Monoraphidium minutum]
MELRNRTVGLHGQLPLDRRPAFEEGVAAVFTQWTALCLAVEGEWGGPHSVDKANQIIQDVIDWFYEKKEHHVDQLEVELDEALVADFNTECEDGSPKQVATTLVQLHQQLLQGDTSLLEQLRGRQASGAASSKRQVVDLDGAELEGGSSSSGEGSDDDEMGDGGDAPPAVPLAAAAPPAEKPAPIVDADGFEMVQSRRRGRR